MQFCLFFDVKSKYHYGYKSTRILFTGSQQDIMSHISDDTLLTEVAFKVPDLMQTLEDAMEDM